jgi:hypothetical protein
LPRLATAPPNTAAIARRLVLDAAPTGANSADPTKIGASLAFGSLCHSDDYSAVKTARSESVMSVFPGASSSAGRA